MTSKQGNWASKLTPQEVSDRMRVLALLKHSKTPKKARIAHATMMVAAREVKRALLILNSKPA